VDVIYHEQAVGKLRIEVTPMCFFFSFIPATFWVVIGYFVLFSSTKTEGAIQTFGRILAIWIFVIAAFLPMAGAYLTFADLCPIEGMFQAMHSGTGLQN
jgi:uncharacterized membrane protein (DUF485 family)